MMKFIVFKLFLFFAITLCAGTRDIGELPHGNIYLVNPEVDDGKTTNVTLHVDRSGVLKNDFIHIVKETSGVEVEIPAKFSDVVPVLPATVYYHALNAYIFMLHVGFPAFQNEIKIILSMSKTEPLTIFPEEKIIIFGKNGLKKHALDSDIIASAIISMFVMTSMEISSTDNLSNELKGIIYGISYYLSCVLSQKSIFASSVLNFDISVLDDKVTNRNNKENISQKVATFFWHLESALKANVTNTLLVNSVFYMNRSSSLNDFILKMLQFDEFFFNKSHFDYIYSGFYRIFFVEK